MPRTAAETTAQIGEAWHERTAAAHNSCRACHGAIGAKEVAGGGAAACTIVLSHCSPFPSRVNVSSQGERAPARAYLAARARPLLASMSGAPPPLPPLHVRGPSDDDPEVKAVTPALSTSHTRAHNTMITRIQVVNRSRRGDTKIL